MSRWFDRTFGRLDAPDSSPPGHGSGASSADDGVPSAAPREAPGALPSPSRASALLLALDVLIESFEQQADAGHGLTHDHLKGAIAALEAVRSIALNDTHSVHVRHLHRIK